MIPEPKPPETYSRKITSQSPQRKLKSVDEVKEKIEELRKDIRKELLHILFANIERVHTYFGVFPRPPDVARILHGIHVVHQLSDALSRAIYFRYTQKAGKPNSFTLEKVKSEVVSSLRRMAKATEGEWGVIPGIGNAISIWDKLDAVTNLFETLATSPKLSALLIRNSNELATITEAVRTSNVYLIKTLSPIRDLFLKDPQKFVEIAKIAKSETPLIFEALKDIKNLFMKYPDEVITVIKVTGEYAPYAVKVLSDPTIAKAAIKNPVKVGVLLKKLAEAATSDGVVDAFKELPKISKLFLKYPEEILKIANVIGGPTYLVFELLSSHPFAKAFLENPKRVSKALINLFKKLSPNHDAAIVALSDLSNPILAKAFLANPQRITKAFASIAKASTKYVNAVEEAFDALSNPTIAKAFLTNPEEITKAFVILSEAAGEGASDIFKIISSKPNFFVKYSNEIATLAKVVNEGSVDFLHILFSSNLSELFARNPKKFIQTVRRLLKVTEDGVHVYTDPHELMKALEGLFE